jgi:hypothetical protein
VVAFCAIVTRTTSVTVMSVCMHCHLCVYALSCVCVCSVMCVCMLCRVCVFALSCVCACTVMCVCALSCAYAGFICVCVCSVTFRASVTRTMRDSVASTTSVTDGGDPPHLRDTVTGTRVCVRRSVACVCVCQ